MFIYKHGQALLNITWAPPSLLVFTQREYQKWGKDKQIYWYIKAQIHRLRTMLFLSPSIIPQSWNTRIQLKKACSDLKTHAHGWTHRELTYQLITICHLTIILCVPSLGHGIYTFVAHFLEMSPFFNLTYISQLLKNVIIVSCSCSGSQFWGWVATRNWTVWTCKTLCICEVYV